MEPTTRTAGSKGGLFEDADARDGAEEPSELESELLPDTRSVLMQTVPVHQHTRKVMQKIVNLLKGLSRKLQTQEDALMAIETAVEVLISHRPHITASLNRIKARLSAPDGTPTYGPKIPSHHQTNAEIHAKVRERVQAKLSEIQQTKPQSPDVAAAPAPPSQPRVANETPSPCTKITHDPGSQISAIGAETQVYAEQLQGSMSVRESSFVSSKSPHEMISKEVKNTPLVKVQSRADTLPYEITGDKFDAASSSAKTGLSNGTSGEVIIDPQAGRPGGRDTESKGGSDIPSKQRILKTHILLKPDADADKDRETIEPTVPIPKANSKEEDLQPALLTPKSPPLFGHNMGAEVIGRDYKLAHPSRSTIVSHSENSGYPWRQSQGSMSVLNLPDHRPKQMTPSRGNPASPQQQPINTSHDFAMQKKIPTLEDAFDLNLPIPPGYEQFEYEYDGDKRESHTDFTPEESLHIAKYIQMIVYNSTKEVTSMLDTRARYRNTHSTFRSGAPDWK